MRPRKKKKKKSCGAIAEKKGCLRRQGNGKKEGEKKRGEERMSFAMPKGLLPYLRPTTGGGQSLQSYGERGKKKEGRKSLTGRRRDEKEKGGRTRRPRERELRVRRRKKGLFLKRKKGRGGPPCRYKDVKVSLAGEGGEGEKVGLWPCRRKRREGNGPSAAGCWEQGVPPTKHKREEGSSTTMRRKRGKREKMGGGTTKESHYLLS